MIINVDEYVEHHGVRGMKWGVRKTARVQKILDRHGRIAEGTASTKDKVLGANRGVFTKKGAARQLQRGANNQAKINSGKMRVSNRLAKIGGIRMQDLKYPVKGDPNAKRDAGQKAAVAAVGVLLVAHGALQLKNL